MSLIFYVNSRNRTNGTDTNFSYQFNQIIDPSLTFKKISLLSISIPKTYYLVDQNQFILYEDTDVIPLSMPIGNYDIIGFAETLSSLMSSNSTHGFDYTISTDTLNALRGPITGKYTYSIQGNSDNLDVAIEVGTTLFEQFGFSRNSINYFIQNNLVSTNVCTMNRESTLYLKTSLCQNDNENTLHEIYTTGTEAGALITYENKNPLVTAKSITMTKNEAWFRLTNEDDQVINTNGVNLNFSLLLTN